MKLDFGRLCWLQGRKYEQDGRARESNEGILMALRKYEQANKVSSEARALFEALSNDRGIAKAWGNLGNATKEIAKCRFKDGQMQDAALRVAESREHYSKSLDVASTIKRKDEIAHALWGLAEVYELFADFAGYKDLRRVLPAANARELLIESLDYALESAALYKSLGGRKDINATERLVTRIKDKIKGDKGDVL